jgi:hypothetical protein
VIFSQIKIAKIENDFQSNQLKIVSYLKSNLAVFGSFFCFCFNGNSCTNYLNCMVGNPSAAEKSSCNYVINNNFFFFLGGEIFWTSYVVNLLKRFKIPTILILYYFLKIKSQIKSLFLKLIFSQIKSSENDLKSDFVKSQIKSLNTLTIILCL